MGTALTIHHSNSADPGGQSNAGASFVVFGKRTHDQDGQLIENFAASFDLASLATGDGSAGFVINGGTAGDKIGESAASAGDVNGDGIDDLIIGASLANPNNQANAGQSYVVFGKRTMIKMVNCLMVSLAVYLQT